MTVQIEKREIGNLVLEGIPEIPAKLSERLNQYQNTRAAHLVDWLNNGSGMLITTRFGESLQFHTVDTPGGIRKQITFFNGPVFNGSMRPNANGFLFSKDEGGTELYQIYYYDLTSGSYRMLTDGMSKNSGGLWNRSGSSFAFTSTKRNQKDHDIYIFDLDKGEEKMLFEAKGLWYPMNWSHDEQWLSVLNFISINECFLYRLNIRTGVLIPISSTQHKVACRGGIWTNDGEGIYYTSDSNHQFRQLIYHHIESGQERILSAGISWDIENLSLAPDGQTLAFTANENGIDKLYLLDTKTEQWELVESTSEGQIYRLKWHPNKNYLGMSINSAQAPGDVYVLDVDANRIVQWTYSELGGLNAKDFVLPTLMHYQTFDKVKGSHRSIPAFYYKPKQVKENIPVLIYIHGGPESQYRPSFLPTFQYYLNELGIAVIAPNVRGSAGYGKKFLKLDNGYKREDSVHDIGKLLDWIDQQPELDSNRVAVMGGSYGGYMVLASMTHYNDRLRCGIDIVGISNFVTFLKNTKSYRRDLRRVEYGDERDPEMRKHLERISPTTNAHKITKPMFIIQGLNDPRVPASEAEQMLKAIRKNGGEAWYLLAKDEGHGFRKKTNRDIYTKTVILFLENYLLN